MEVFVRLQEIFGRYRNQPHTTAESEYPSIIVSRAVCEATIRSLRSHAPTGEEHEGVAYWAGTTLNDLSLIVVSSCIVPEALTGPGHYEVSAVSNARVTNAVHEHDIEILGLVHSHPQEWTGHSPTDDDEAFLPFDGYYSIVVPNYAADGLLPLTKCGIHRYENTNFRELTTAEVDRTFTVVPAPPVSIDTRP